MDMEEKIVEEIKKECNLGERILLKVFKKEFLKIFNIIRLDIVNKIL